VCGKFGGKNEESGKIADFKKTAKTAKIAKIEHKKMILGKKHQKTG
jgi:hypothetical protein